MADLVLGLAKMTVQGTVTMARSAMEDEAKMKKSVQRDLMVISDEFEMMRTFLNHAKDHDTDDLTRTRVRQVRNMAIDMEDCIETIFNLDNKPHWWRGMIPSWCMPARVPVKDLDAAVANIEQLKARVEAMGQRNLRYNRIDDSGHKPEKTHQQATAADAGMHRARMDLAKLINLENNTNQARTKGGAEGEQPEPRGVSDDRDYEDRYNDSNDDDNDTDDDNQQKKEESDINLDKEIDDVHQLKVISVFGTGNGIEMMSIKKAYEDQETCKNFNHRAWVKLVHPFHPAKFIRSLLAQFYNNCCPKQDNNEHVLKLMVAIDNALIMEFKSKISEKYLVVLEDVSSMVDWEAVRAYLPDKKNGSCIVVHTRRFEVARSCVGNGYQVSELEKNPSVYLLYKEVYVLSFCIMLNYFRKKYTPSFIFFYLTY
ncbi:hypothetical protein HU200_048867 [Digitaria exilis]|uniref:Uncharacterized protein n=1 Tax=Digitaria exilis TaxID=1010633 RepID=A0A835AUW3_9POAL|nr:hypothetical protein HU200_048867 [Digitaria exilis]